MGTNALGSHGTIIARQDNGAGAFVNVGELLSVNSPARSREEIDTTSLADDIDYYIPGGIERRESVTLNVQVDPDGASYGSLEASFQAGQTDGWRITYPDNSELIFSGFISAMGGLQADMDNKLTEDITVRPSGAYIDTNV